MAYQAPKVDPTAYGIWTPRYAESVAASTGNPAADIINQLALSLRARSEEGGYLKAIQAMAENQLAGQAADNEAEIAKAMINSGANNANAGVSSAYTMPGPNRYLNINPDVLRFADTQHLDATMSGSYDNYTKGLKQASEAGFAPNAEDVGYLLTPPGQNEPVKYLPYVNPGDQAALQQAVASGVRAQASMVHAKRGGNPDGGDGVKITMEPSAFGLPPAVKVTGKSVDAVTRAANAAQGGGGGGNTVQTSKYENVGGKWQRKKDKK